MTSEAKDFLDAVRGYIDRPGPRNRIGTVDSGYTSGRPRILFDGETVLGGKLYPYLAAYTPVAGHRVLLVPAGSSYVIVGRIT